MSCRTCRCPGVGCRGSSHGQTTVLLVVFALCLLLVISAVTDISASYLRRQAASSLADGAALSAADAAAAATPYRDPDEHYVSLDPAAAQVAVETYLEETGAYGDYAGLHCEVEVEGHVVTVSLTMPFRLPIHVPGAEAETMIHASASSEMPIY